MPLGDFINRNIKEGAKEATGTGLGRAFIGLSAVTIAASNEKLKETIKLLKDIALFKIAWPFALIGMFKGLQGVIKGVVRDTGSLDAALRRLSAIRGLEGQFLAVKRGAIEARRHVAALFQWSNKSPFNIEKTAAASRSFELMGRGVYGSIEALETFGDVASSTNNEIERVSSTVSTFFSEVLDGAPIDQTVDEMRQLGIITSDTARRFTQMQRDGSTSVGMIEAMKTELAKARGGMREHSRDIGVLNEKYDTAKENLKAGFGAAFVDKEKDAIEATTKILVALTPAITVLGQHLADVAGAFSNITLRFTAWLTTFKSAQPVLTSFAGVIGTTVKALSALLVIGAARSFVGLLSGTNAVSRGLLAMSAGAGKALSAINALAFGGTKGIGRRFSTAGDAISMAGSKRYAYGVQGRPMDAEFGPLTKDQAATAAKTTASWNTQMVTARATATAAGAAMRGFGAAVSFAGVALRGLIAATVWMLVLQAAVIIVTKLTEQIEEWSTGMTKGERAAASMREETVKLSKALQDQVNSIQTAADRQEALTAINEEAAAALKNLHDLQEKGSGVGDLTGGIIGTETASKEEIAAARQRIAVVDKKRTAATSAAVEETDEARAVRTADARRKRMEREVAFQSRMNYYSTAGQLVTRQRKIDQVQEEVDLGEKLITERARISKEQDVLNTKIKNAEGERAKSVAVGGSTVLHDSKLAGLHAEAVRMKQGSSSASLSAEGNIEAIQAAIQAANLQSSGGSKSDVADARARGGGYTGQDRDSLMRQLDEERNKRDRAKEIEDNLSGNQNRAAEMRADQISQILKGDNPVASSLARVGLGGGTGESEMLSIARQHKDLTAQILQVLEAQNKGITPDSQGDDEVFGTH